MKFLPAILLTVLLGTACSEESTVANSDTIEDFSERLRADMNFETLVRSFGEPDRDIGSGIHIYVYVLADSTEVRIGFTDRILYANHLDRDHQLLKILI